MTTSTQALALVSAISAFVGGAIIIPSNPQPFMVVHEIEYVADMVKNDRTLRGVDGQSVIADWRVTVVPQDDISPICQTVPGRLKGQGWDEYKPSGRATVPMPLDKWVGDDGCYERLPAGENSVHVSWTPRNGGPVVYDRGTLIKEPAQ